MKKKNAALCRDTATPVAPTRHADLSRRNPMKTEAEGEDGLVAPK